MTNFASLKFEAKVEVEDSTVCYISCDIPGIWVGCTPPSLMTGAASADLELL